MLHIKPVQFLNNLLIVMTIGIALSLIFIGHSKADDIGSITTNINATGIQTGTGPFDSDDDPGHDSSANNNIVRAYDVVTIPLSIAIGSKEGSNTNVNSYVLSIDGTIDNGYSNNRTNAGVYLPTAYTDTISINQSSNNTTFHIEYSGTSPEIQFPLKMLVYGALNGTKLTPHIKVTVKSINGIAQSNTSATVEGLKTITVSSIEDFGALGICSSGYYIYTGSGNLPHTSGQPEILNPFYQIYAYPNRSKGKVIPQNFDINFDMTSQEPVQISPSSYFPDFSTAYSLVPNNLSSTDVPSGCTTSFDYSITNSPTINFRNFDPGLSVYDNLNNVFSWSWSSYKFINLYTPYNNYYWVGGPKNKDKIENTITIKANVNGSFTSSITGQKVTQQLIPDLSTNIYNDTPPVPVPPPTPIPDTFGGLLMTYSSGDFDYSDNINYNYLPTVGFNREMNICATFRSVSGNVRYPVFNGGYTVIYNWNPNSFQLSDDDKKKMEKEVDGQKSTIQYGTVDVQKHSDFIYTGENMYKLGKDDFIWHNTYPTDEVVSAVKFDQTSSASFDTFSSFGTKYELSLKTTSRFGATDSDGNPNNIYQNATFYDDQDRKQSISGRAPFEKYINSTIYDINNNLVKTASDGNSFITVNFVRNKISGLTHVPFWNNDWTLSAAAYSNTNVSILLLGLNTQLDSTHPDTKQKITRTITLPEGIEYLSGTTKLANYNGIDYSKYSYPALDDPTSITLNPDGSHTLIWTYYLSYNDLQKIKQQNPPSGITEIPAIEYKVYLDSYNWTFTNGLYQVPLLYDYNEQKFSVEGNTPGYRDIGGDNETYTLNVNQVGGPEASSSIDSYIGYPGAAFTVMTKPYVSSDSEKDLKGIIPIPKNNEGFTVDGQTYTNSFSGQIYIADVSFSVDNTKTNIPKSAVDIYYSNDEKARTENPNNAATNNSSDQGITWHKIDFSDPDYASKLTSAKAIMYHVNGDFKFSDRGILINVKFQTYNNKPKDKYYARSSISAASYGTNSNARSNTSTYSAYTIVDEFFSGKLWDDTNIDGLIDNNELPFKKGIHLKLFKKASDGSWNADQRFDPINYKNTSDPVEIDEDGNYTIIAMEGGTYRVGVSKADLDHKNPGYYIPTLLQQGADSSKNSQISTDIGKDKDNNGNVVEYYLTKDSYELPDPESGSIGGKYEFKDINGGFYSSVGDLDLSIVPSLDFGKHKIPYSAIKTFDNTMSNEIRVSDGRNSYPKYKYDLKVKLSPFKLNGAEEIPHSYLSFNKASGISNLTLPTQVNVYPNQTEETLFSYTGSGAQTIDYTYDSIQLTTPQKSGTNPIDPGKYKATLTYSLETAP